MELLEKNCTPGVPVGAKNVLPVVSVLVMSHLFTLFANCRYFLVCGNFDDVTDDDM